MFHSMFAEGKKFLKKVCLRLKEGMLSVFLVAYRCFLGVNFKKTIGDFSFCKFGKIFIFFRTNVVIEGILNLILNKNIL